MVPVKHGTAVFARVRARLCGGTAVPPDVALFTKTSQNSMEKIADVIKNITRVNNVLQDLIKNYEHLENIYKSKEMTDNYVTNVPTETTTQNRTGTDLTMYATRMPEDKSPEKHNKLHVLKRKVKSKILIGKPTPSRDLDETERPKPVTPQILFIDLFGSNNKKSFKHITTPKKKRFNVQLKNNMKREGKHFEIITNETVTYTTQTPVSSTTTATKPFGRMGTTTMSPNGLFIKIKGTIKKPQGKMYVLSGSMKNKTMLDENVNKTHAQQKYDEVKRAITDQNLASRDMELVMASDNETTDESGSVLSIELPVHNKNDDAINKDIFKTNILRKAYGDACLKLVVKKCHMACKNTITSVCKHSSCKKGVKKVFNKSYKEKCNELFGDMMLRSNSPSVHVDDNTRTYMAAVCDPIESTDSPNMTTVAQPTPSTTTSKYVSDLLMLRAKYEKACVNSSREKCKDACTYAYTAACKGDKCNSKKTRNFRKTCSRQCKIAYKLRLTPRDSSSSSSTSSSSEM